MRAPGLLESILELLVARFTMNTMLAQRHPNSLFCKAHWARFAARVVPVALGGLGIGLARAEEMSDLPAIDAVASTGDSMNSRLGRMAPAVLPAAPPKVTVEHAPAAGSERALAPLGGVSYRWWLTHGPSNFGLGVGSFAYVVPSLEIGGPPFLTYSASMLTVGYRYQVNPSSTVFADASGARHFDGDTADRYSTKVGVEWKARSNNLGLDGASRSLTFQLDSGYRMSLKVRRNGVGVYLKGQF